MAAFIVSHHLVPPDSHVLVAVSGGPDSCALFSSLVHLKQQLKIARLGAIYVDHGFRPEAKGEALYVKELATGYGAEFYLGELNLTHGTADEERGRAGRYAIFSEIACKEHYDLVALAHHADDVAETWLINLSRGSGLMGLRGIAPKRDIYIRPLLGQRRIDILTYCEQRGLKTCLDASNLGTDYLRNRIRLQLLPLWNQVAGREITPILGRNADIMAAEDEFLEKTASSELQNILIKTEPYTLSLPAYRKLDLALQRRVARLAIRSNLSYYYQPSYEQVGQFLAIAKAGRGKLWLPDDLQLSIIMDELVIAKRQVLEKSVNEIIPDSLVIDHFGTFTVGKLKLEIKEEKLAAVGKSDQTRVVNFDLDQIKWPLTIRQVQPLDKMSLMGHQRLQPLSKVMSDLKISLSLRPRQLVMCDATGEIMWLLGQRRSAKAKITEKQLTNVLTVTITEAGTNNEMEI